MARIIVVDDDARLREATRDILESEGHVVVEAKDGNAAVLAHRAQPADVIVCDMFMPRQDGIETILVLRKESPDVRIIAVSGGGYSGAIDVLTMARHMGASEVLNKPFTGAQLTAAIGRLLASPKA